MAKDDNIGKTLSLDGPSGAVKSAVGVIDLDNSTANSNQDDVDALPPSTLPKKRLFDSHEQPPGRRPSTTSPSSILHSKDNRKEDKMTEHTILSTLVESNR